jgi:hypothetical protein
VNSIAIRRKIRTVRPRSPVALACIVALGAGLALAGNASAHRGAARTTVTIRAESDGFFGFVKSPKARCANNRKVILFRQLGRTQSPRTDARYMVETAEKQGNRFRWDTGNSGNVSGRYYARAPKRPGCRAGSSMTVSQPLGD